MLDIQFQQRQKRGCGLLNTFLMRGGQILQRFTRMLISATPGSWVSDPRPVFVNFLRSPGIDSQPGGSVRQLFVVPRPPGYIGWQNRFLSSLNVYKYGLRIRPVTLAPEFTNVHMHTIPRAHTFFC
jgi:hypothetical protein